MRYKILFILVFGYLFCGVSQNTKDVGFIKNQPYLEYANSIDCDSTSGSNIEHRICLNIELRRIDSMMLSKFNKLLNITEIDSLKTILKDFQVSWESQRKSISLIMADGLESNVEAIVYMHSMLELTKLRLKALNYILDEEED